MTGNSLSKGLLKIGNLIKNLVDDKEDVLALEPDIMSDGKITRILSKFVVAPNVIMDNDLKYVEPSNLSKVIKAEMDLFTAVYVNAFQVLLTVYDLEPKVVIDKLSNADRADSLKDIKRVRDLINGSESFDFVEDALFNTDGILPIAGVEARNRRNRRYNRKPNRANVKTTVINKIKTSKSDDDNKDKKKTDERTAEIALNKFGRDAEKFINTYNISFKVVTKKGDTKVVSFPIIVYPNLIYTDARTLIGNILDSDVDKTFLDRLDQYRAGLISFTDLIFATDLVRKYREKKIKNPNDVALYLNAMDKTTTIKEVLHNKKAFYKNFNIYIFDINKKPIIEKQIKGSLLKNKYKDTFLDKFSAFSACFVDDPQEEAIFFIDSIPGFSVVSYKMLSKEKNDEIGKLLKDLFSGRQPF